MKKIILSLFLFLSSLSLSIYAQSPTSPPWKKALRIATSSDGTTFGAATVFQDSSGVPCLIRLSTGVLVTAFQWFPAPQYGPGWDSIAVKFSTDNGLSWSSPTSTNFSGIPRGYRRPFDPTIVETDAGQIRMFFSSGIGMGPLDANVNTYSAISNDGINYIFENNARFDVLNKEVIDPACVKFKGLWHYTAPIGAPQDGAYHATSTDGLNFTPLANIPSDMQHNFTGNLMVNSSNEMRFYGSSGNALWWASTTDGTNWSGFTNTNVMPSAGGDPAVVKLPNGTYIMLYVGPAPTVNETTTTTVKLYPNPAKDLLFFSGIDEGVYTITIMDMQGKMIMSKKHTQNNSIDISFLKNGIYIIELVPQKTGESYRRKFIKIRQ